MKIKTFFLVFFSVLLNFVALTKVDAFDNISSKLHAYMFWGCTPGMKSNRTFDCDKSQRFRILEVTNYSVAQLYSMAVLEGGSIPKENILIPPSALLKLSERYCYRLTTYESDASDIYRLMLNSLKDQFPGYTLAVEIRNGKKFLVFKHK